MLQGEHLQHLSSRIDPKQVLSALRFVLPSEKREIPLHEPEFGVADWLYLKECVETGWVSTAGRFVERFESSLSEYTGAKHAIAVVNGTAALHVCLLLSGVEKGDEVLVPALTFVATANAVSYCGGTPHFVDVEEATLGVDPTKARDYLRQIATLKSDGCFNRITGRRIKALVPMHTFGHPVRLDLIEEVCREFRLELVEDSAEALGSHYGGRHLGTWGRVGALSFNGNKIVTTGGGGAILTNSSELALAAKHLTTTARVAHGWSYIHDRVGFNYRLPNINAALGCAQLERVEKLVSKKRELALKYHRAFENVAGANIFMEPKGARSNYWLNCLILDQQYEDQRDLVLHKTNAEGILTRPIWTLMHRLPMYEGCPRMDLSTAEGLERRTINLPSSAILGAV